MTERLSLCARFRQYRQPSLYANCCNRPPGAEIGRPGAFTTLPYLRRFPVFWQEIERFSFRQTVSAVCRAAVSAFCADSQAVGSFWLFSQQQLFVLWPHPWFRSPQMVTSSWVGKNALTGNCILANASQGFSAQPQLPSLHSLDGMQ